MHKLIVLMCILASALGSTLESLEERKLRRNEPTSLFANERIVGGVQIDISEVPYLASITYIISPICGGSLITESHVLTAAHCLEGYIRAFSVRVGSSKTAYNGTAFDIAAKIPHPQFQKPIKFDYDVGIIVLEKKAPLGENVKLIPLADVEAPAGTMIQVSGWGNINVQGGRAPGLMKVSYPLISRSECQDKYNGILHRHTVTERMICAHQENKGPCNGDSGGPAVVNGTLYGIVSWGVGCGSRHYPGVFVNVANKDVRAFIHEHANV